MIAVEPVATGRIGTPIDGIVRSDEPSDIGTSALGLACQIVRLAGQVGGLSSPWRLSLA
ncbi:hypothetical protein [Ilumatobacter sp.]|uniref:hypothetical protein n=1 Tax=Ilumatobacter sp. TaxID=1967498 RepID=UPI0037501BAD